MKRTISHLFVSLLTFSFGLAFVWLVSPEQVTEVHVSSPPAEPPAQSAASQNTVLPPIIYPVFIKPPGDKRVVCKDRTIALVWRQLTQTKDFWDDVNPTFDEFNCAELFEATTFDLNGDGIAEIKIRGKYGNHCGATGNCSEWVFGKNHKTGRYRLILESGGEHFAIKRISTNGYRDIYIRTHDSAASSYHMVYKFNGKRYYEAKCWFSEYMYDESIQTMSCKEKSKQYEDNP